MLDIGTRSLRRKTPESGPDASSDSQESPDGDRGGTAGWIFSHGNKTSARITTRCSFAHREVGTDWREAG